MSMKSMTMMPPMSRSLQLPDGLIGSLEVRPEDRVLETALAHELAGVHVDRGERLGLVDSEMTSARQRDSPAQRDVDHVGDPVRFKQRRPVLVKLDATDELRRRLLQKRHDLLERGLVVDEHAVELIGEHVSHESQREVHLGVDDLRRQRLGRLVVDALPQPQQELEIGAQDRARTPPARRSGLSRPCRRAPCRR